MAKTFFWAAMFCGVFSRIRRARTASNRTAASCSSASTFVVSKSSTCGRIDPSQRPGGSASQVWCWIVQVVLQRGQCLNRPRIAQAPAAVPNFLLPQHYLIAGATDRQFSWLSLASHCPNSLQHFPAPNALLFSRCCRTSRMPKPAAYRPFAVLATSTSPSDGSSTWVAFQSLM